MQTFGHAVPVTLNTWWSADPTQRYWMEITQRPVLGGDLLAPQLDAAGRMQWSYELVSEVKSGDRVLHYRTNAAGGAAIVGWSEAVDGPSTGTITWQARGTRGRARGQATTGRSWFVPLGGFHEFDSPVKLSDVTALEHELMRLHRSLGKCAWEPSLLPLLPIPSG